jgi:hypothetical protein
MRQKTRLPLFLQVDRALGHPIAAVIQCKLRLTSLQPQDIVSDRQTSLTPKLPYFALALLLVTYVIFGWLLYAWTKDRVIWLIVAFAIVLFGGFLAYPSQSVSLSFGRFFKTDIRAFILIILTSIGSVILLTWLKFFVDAVVLCAAGLLVSLDLKTGGWSKPMTLLIIIGWQLLGMSIGLYLHDLWSYPPSDLPAYFYISYWGRLLAPFIQSLESLF